MSNSAIVTLSADTKKRGVFVYWNGGEGSIKGLVEEAQKRFEFSVTRDCNGPIILEDDIQTFYAIFYGVCREFFAYCTQFPNRKVDKCELLGFHGAINTHTDCGVYEINTDFTCDRLKNITRGYEQNTYERIADFFETSHILLLRK